MPVFTPDNTDQYYRVFDANGLEWHHVTLVDTDKGEIEQFARDERNGTIRVDLSKVRTSIAAPISLVPIGKKLKKESHDHVDVMIRDNIRWKLNAAESSQSWLEDIRYKCWNCGYEFLTAFVKPATHCPLGCGPHVERFEK
jgi:hypothetical protein